MIKESTNGNDCDIPFLSESYKVNMLYAPLLLDIALTIWRVYRRVNDESGNDIRLG
jgi:hypothetical protein